MKWERAGLAGLCVVVLLTAGCTAAGAKSSPSTATAGSTTPAAVAQACSVTPATKDGIPAGVAAQKYGPVYGQGNLWVGAWWAEPSGLKQARTKVAGGVGGDAKHPYGMKYPTWKVQDGQVTGKGGRPRVTVTSLDGHGRGSSDVGGYVGATDTGNPVNRWFPTVIGVTAHGCYRVTETQGGDSLAYIIKL